MQVPTDPVQLGPGTISPIDPCVTGWWKGPFPTPMFAAHAALVYNRDTRKAKVLMFSGGGEQR